MKLTAIMPLPLLRVSLCLAALVLPADAQQSGNFYRQLTLAPDGVSSSGVTFLFPK